MKLRVVIEIEEDKEIVDWRIKDALRFGRKSDDPEALELCDKVLTTLSNGKISVWRSA